MILQAASGTGAQKRVDIPEGFPYHVSSIPAAPLLASVLRRVFSFPVVL